MKAKPKVMFEIKSVTRNPQGPKYIRRLKLMKRLYQFFWIKKKKKRVEGKDLRLGAPKVINRYLLISYFEIGIDFAIFIR